MVGKGGAGELAIVVRERERQGFEEVSAVFVFVEAVCYPFWDGIKGFEIIWCTFSLIYWQSTCATNARVCFLVLLLVLSVVVAVITSALV
jgi:hypothetical protein